MHLDEWLSEQEKAGAQKPKNPLSGARRPPSGSPETTVPRPPSGSGAPPVRPQPEDAVKGGDFTQTFQRPASTPGLRPATGSSTPPKDVWLDDDKTRPLNRPPSRMHAKPAAPRAESAPPAEASEFTRMFQSGAGRSAEPAAPNVEPAPSGLAATKPLPPRAPASPPPPAPRVEPAGGPSEFNRTFEAGPGVPTIRRQDDLQNAETIPLPMPPVVLPNPSEAPTDAMARPSNVPGQPPGEFTRMFQTGPGAPAHPSSGKPVADPPAVPPSSVKPAVVPPAAPPASVHPAVVPPAALPGPSARPSAPPSPPLSNPSPLRAPAETAGEFTKMFQAGPGSPPTPNARPAAAPPVSPSAPLAAKPAVPSAPPPAATPDPGP